MAATDLSTLKGPFLVKRVSLPSSAGNAREVILPTWCRYATVRFFQSGDTDDSGKFASSGTDDAAIGNDAMPVDSGVTFTNIAVSDGCVPSGAKPKIYLSGGTASGYAIVVAQRDAS